MYLDIAVEPQISSSAHSGTRHAVSKDHAAGDDTNDVILWELPAENGKGTANRQGVVERRLSSRES